MSTRLGRHLARRAQGGQYHCSWSGGALLSPTQVLRMRPLTCRADMSGHSPVEPVVALVARDHVHAVLVRHAAHRAVPHFAPLTTARLLNIFPRNCLFMKFLKIMCRVEPIEATFNLSNSQQSKQYGELIVSKCSNFSTFPKGVAIGRFSGGHLL